jgi:membrane-associated phospholipid phosphatase
MSRLVRDLLSGWEQAQERVETDRTRRLNRIVWVTAGLVIVIACIGRVWAGAHWPTDVIGGFFLGLGWSAFTL